VVVVPLAVEDREVAVEPLVAPLVATVAGWSGAFVT
jgi:hypothetical protein